MMKKMPLKKKMVIPKTWSFMWDSQRGRHRYGLWSPRMYEADRWLPCTKMNVVGVAVFRVLLGSI